MTLVIVIAVIAALVLYGVSVQNSLVKSDELCNNALKQISVQQTSRYDVIMSLIKLTREYSSYESETLQKVVEARRIVTANPSVKDIQENEAVLNSTLSRLIAVAEQYPDLKASTNYQESMKSIKEYEENVRLSRMTFNDTVTKYNNQVRMFPSSIFAAIFGFSKRDYLEENPAKMEFPEF